MPRKVIVPRRTQPPRNKAKVHPDQDEVNNEDEKKRSKRTTTNKNAIKEGEQVRKDATTTTATATTSTITSEDSSNGRIVTRRSTSRATSKSIIHNNNSTKDEDNLNVNVKKTEEGEEEEEDLSDIVVIKTGPPPPEGGGGSSPSGGSGGNASSEDDLSSPTELASFSVLVNVDGSMILENKGEAVQGAELGPSQERVIIQLPKSKIKSPDNPFPGGVPLPGGRSSVIVTAGASSSTSTTAIKGRKSKPEAAQGSGSLVSTDMISSGGETTMSDGINQVQDVVQPGSGATPIDMDELTRQLDPQTLATLDNLIQSQELMDNLELEHQISSAPQIVEQSGVSSVSSADSLGVGGSPASSVGTGSQRSGRQSSRGRTTPVSARASESGESVRRSLRQQDRIERQEAERILAENQQMLQREKEMLQNAQKTPTQIPSAPPTPTTQSPKKEEKPHPSPAPISTPKPSKTPSGSISSPRRDSIKSTDSDGKTPRRERKVPAHLKDPNFVSLDEGVKPEDEGTEADQTSSSVPEDEDYVPEDYTEDDPNKLWCICRQPHNNRFMICCDTCEDWFHGKCVGISKGQGKAMELKNIRWFCPNCRKADADKRKKEKSDVRDRDSRRLSKGAKDQQAEAAAAAAASKNAHAPERVGVSSKSIRRSESESHGGQCVVCNKPARKESIYCSDACVQKHAGSLSRSGEPSTPNKLKRTNSKVDSKGEPIFNFHVVTPGASKSTEIVPPKPKEMTASQMLKAQKEQLQSPTKTTAPAQSYTVSPTTASAIERNPPTVLVKKVSTDAQSLSRKESTQKSESHRDEKDKSRSSRTRTSSSSDNKGKSQTTSRRSEPSRPMSDKEAAKNEKLQREVIRRGIKATLEGRLKEMTTAEQEKINSSPNDPETLAEKIEQALCKHYGGATTIKCKAKYRSIFFNLKDPKNKKLYVELFKGRIKPEELVKMESNELASSEVAEWREKEAKKELEAIKKAELDKIAESKKMQLLEKGVDDAHKVVEELRQQDISEIIGGESIENVQKGKDKDVKKDKDKASSSSKSKSKHEHARIKSSSSHDKDSKSHHRDKDHHDKDRRRSDRHKDKDKDKGRHSSSSSRKDQDGDKDKVKHSDNKHKEKDKHSKESEQSSGSPSEEQSKSSTDSGDDKQLEIPILHPEVTPPPEPVQDIMPVTSKQELLKPIGRHSVDSEQEQPSSTIKTPDFIVDDGSKKDSEPDHLFQAHITMPDLGKFKASVHAVSHTSHEGLCFPRSPVPVVGRIEASTVWDYVSKMKKSKEVIVFRLTPASPEDSDGYMTFYSYFQSRARLGVMGGIERPLKDVYLIPLSKQEPIPRCLLPFRGPGIPEDRTHCLLCVVTRNVPNPALALKRKSSALVEPFITKKRVKIDPQHAGTSRVPPSKPKATDKANDDDAPYTPWDEESSSNSDSQPPLLTPEVPRSAEAEAAYQKQLQEIEMQIAKEKQDILKIQGALEGRVNMPGIPGLDGEFGDGDTLAQGKSHPVVEHKSSSSSSSPPDIVEETHVQSSTRLVTPDELDVKASNPEAMDVSEDSSSSSKEQPVKPQEQLKPQDSEEAYSPSALHYSDEDNSNSNAEQKKELDMPTKVQPAKDVSARSSGKVELAKLSDDDEPLPPGLTKEEMEYPVPPPVIVKPSAPVEDIKITLPKAFLSRTNVPVPVVQAPPLIDLEEDDFQPPKPLAKQTEVVSDSIFEKEAPVLPSASKAVTGGSSSGASAKISIHFKTKQLPPPEEAAPVPSTSFPNTSLPPPIPTHLPPPPMPHAPTYPGFSQVPGQHHFPPMNIPSLSPIPIHIPPPPGSNSSVVVNLNVPPPPFTQQGCSRPIPPYGPPGMGYSGPSQGPSFPPHHPPRFGPPGNGPPSFGACADQLPTRHQGMPGPSTFESDRFSRGREDDIERVPRFNLEKDQRPFFRGGPRGSPRGGDRFGRRRFDRERSPVQKIRRRRSRSGGRSRSRSRSKDRERRLRRRSRSRSPLSRRWEARNKSRSRSRSRSPGRRRNRSRSRSRSPRRRRSKSPRQTRKGRTPSPRKSKSRSPSPPSPLLRKDASKDKQPQTQQHSDDEWEADDSKKSEQTPTEAEDQPSSFRNTFAPVD